MQARKIKSFSELFINKIFEYTFVTFEYEQTILSLLGMHFFLWVGCVKSCQRLHNAMCNFTKVAQINQTDMFKYTDCC